MWGGIGSNPNLNPKCPEKVRVHAPADACVTMSGERQEASLRAVAGYCRQRTTEDLLAELDPEAVELGGGGKRATAFCKV